MLDSLDPQKTFLITLSVESRNDTIDFVIINSMDDTNL